MQSKRKKFWIIFSIVCTCIICVLITFSLVFRVKTVDVELRSRAEQSQTHLPDGIKDKVLLAGNFAFGSNMFFYKTDKSVAQIEKQIPYIKVEQVIKYFPDIIRVYITEREMCYRVQDKSNPANWYILDKDFKILEKVNSDRITNDSDYYNRTFEVNPSTITLSAEVGDFATTEDAVQVKNYLNLIADGIYGRTRDIGKVSTVNISGNSVDELKVSITLKNKGVKIAINGANRLTEKVFAGISLFYNEDMNENPSVSADDTIVVEEINGQIDARVIKAQSEE